MFALGLPLRVQDMRTPCTPPACENLHLSVEGAQALQKTLGITPLGFAVFTTLMETYLMLAFLVSGVVIAWRKSDDWMALFTSGVLVLAGVGLTAFLDTLVRQMPIFAIPFNLVEHLGYPLTILLFYLFPDGHFSPGWARWPAFISTGITAFIDLKYGSISPLGLPFLALALAGGVLNQAYRYRRVSSPAERQQTKWVILGFTGMLLGIAITTVAFLLWPFKIEPSRYYIGTVPDFLFAGPFTFVFFFIPQSLVPITFAISTLRFRLWSVDPILNRTMVYGTLTGAMALIYLISVVLLQSIFSSQSQVAIVISTLAAAALSSPLRRRIQNAIDKRFYRRKYDPEKVIAAFSTRMRDEVDLEKMTVDLLGLFEETYQPECVSLWLKRD
jgi:hypothetical protein